MLLIGLLVVVSLQAHDGKDDIMVKMADKTYRINTTSLCNQIKGFKGNTPLLVYIKKNQIVKIEPLSNKETPSYFNRATKGMFAQYIGKDFSKKNSTIQVDGVTGATYSSNAIRQNVEKAIEYYLNHR